MQLKGGTLYLQHLNSEDTSTNSLTRPFLYYFWVLFGGGGVVLSSTYLREGFVEGEGWPPHLDSF